MTSLAFAAIPTQALALDTLQAKKLAEFPSDISPDGLMVLGPDDAVYGVGYDYTLAGPDQITSTWVYRISPEGNLTRPCPAQQGGNGHGPNVVFDRHGDGYTIGADGILKFSQHGECKLAATFGADLSREIVTGTLSIEPSGAIWGSTRAGKLFVVDAARGTTSTAHAFAIPTNAALTGIQADLKREGIFFGTIAAATSAGTVQTQLFSFRFPDRLTVLNQVDQPVYAFDDNVASHDRLVVTALDFSYLLAESGEIVSDKLPGWDFPLGVEGDQLYYPYQTTTVIPPVPPAHFPTILINWYVGRSALDGSDRQPVADVTQFGSPSSEVLPGRHDDFYLIMAGAGPNALIEVSNSLSRHGGP
jgi:hypothetical protein